MRVTFRAPPPANPARIPVNASVAQYYSVSKKSDLGPGAAYCPDHR
jgi:hypothetical protein